MNYGELRVRIGALLSLLAATSEARLSGHLSPNKRMDQSWRGHPVVKRWHARRRLGKISTSSRATLVMRGR